MRYKFYLAFSFISFVLLFNGCTPKNENSFIISGNVPNLTNDYILLSHVQDFQTNKTVLIDSLKVNKRGKFNAVYFLEPGIYTLSFDNKKTVPLAINKGQHIVLKGDNLDDLKISGSSDTQLLNDYESFRTASLNQLVKSIRDTIKKLKKEKIRENEIAELREIEVENYEHHLNELVQFIKEKMGTSIAIYATSTRWNSKNLPFLKELVSKFEKEHPQIEITKNLKNKIQLLQKTSIGSVVSNIKIPNQLGEIIQLNTIKSTYTLIDFWASWCPPCRTESTLLNELYTTYHSKGFEIYGISLDSNKDRWLKALEMDNRIWTNVSTVEGFKTPVSIEYGITALPTNFLIDANGKIIASNIHGKYLKAKIEELFKH
jgi:thiol-disulfide isomerase/thioredoxin